jgi:hypothetical protein
MFLFARGQLDTLMKLFPDAIKDFDTITRGNPLNEDSYLKRAIVYFKMGNRSLASSELFKAFEKFKAYDGKLKKIKDCIKKYLNYTIYKYRVIRNINQHSII